MNDSEFFFQKANQLLSRLENLIGETQRPINWDYIAFRWRPKQGLQPVLHPHRVRLEDLLCMKQQKAEITRNTEQFLSGKSANNVLLWGARGTGKSSLIKAILNAYSEHGLRLIEVERPDLVHLPEIADLLAERPERFIIFSDDLSFEADDASYKSLKAMLDGSVAAPPENVIIYATSNRRHLMPEYMRENHEAQYVDGEIHQGETTEEKISLSERFGLWLSFYPFTQEQYLQIVDHWLEVLKSPTDTQNEATRLEALRWATQRGSRSGRVAHQFARDWAGRRVISQGKS